MAPAFRASAPSSGTAPGDYCSSSAGKTPRAGKWSLPGGRIAPGETDAQALVREMRDETGLTVLAGPLLGAMERPGPPGWAAGQLAQEDWATRCSHDSGGVVSQPIRYPVSAP